jgi:hypothetical protein
MHLHGRKRWYLVREGMMGMMLSFHVKKNNIGYER